MMHINSFIQEGALFCLKQAAAYYFDVQET